MNGRIQELSKQATIRGEEYLPGNDGHPTPTVYFDKEKFAELIVKECAKHAEHAKGTDVEFEAYFKAMIIGVEE